MTNSAPEFVCQPGTSVQYSIDDGKWYVRYWPVAGYQSPTVIPTPTPSESDEAVAREIKDKCFSNLIGSGGNFDERTCSVILARHRNISAAADLLRKGAEMALEMQKYLKPISELDTGYAPEEWARHQGIGNGDHIPDFVVEAKRLLKLVDDILKGVYQASAPMTDATGGR